MDEKTQPKILIIEDEMITAKSIEKSLLNFGFEVVGVAKSYVDGYEKVIDTNPDLILMDIKLKGLEDGITLTERIQAYTDVPIIFLTAYYDATTFSRALATSPYGYLLKPYSEKELYETIRKALGRYKYRKDIN